MNRYIPIKMGMLGMSLENITAGKQGWVKLPIGPRDLTMAGGREWVKVKVTAMEDVRENRDIIVGNDQGEIKEHTPVELSYEKLEGGYQRVGEAHPLPTGGGYAEPASVTATASDDTEVKKPASGKKLSIKFIYVFNSGVASRTVYLHFTTTGDAHFKANLAPQTGYTLNLVGCNWHGEKNEPLYVNLDAVGTINVSVLIHEVE